MRSLSMSVNPALALGMTQKLTSKGSAALWLSHSVESGAGKRRVFAIGNYVNQRLLRPLHNWFMKALGDLKTDGTFNQSAPIDRLVGAKKIYSIAQIGGLRHALT
ncbi:RNA-dependent RNA polymerase [Striga asiatica]|uniref:RNA-dependent RNA polymerase n=1 Tax=Striga asiatica TaxID=4170 RepID=A0A5A7QY46_STRAF|nr:RNA-dependent RNA polymerase [Striga asiatica]